MELVLCNTQSELHPLEEGKHAAESGMDLKAYAEASGKVYTTLSTKHKAWQVLSVTHVSNADARESWRNLAEIRSAPNWLWSALVKQMIESGWTVQVTRDKVASFKDCPAVPEWADSEKVAEALVSATTIETGGKKFPPAHRNPVATHDPAQLPLKPHYLLSH